MESDSVQSEPAGFIDEQTEVVRSFITELRRSSTTRSVSSRPNDHDAAERRRLA